jgi:hypothetical protein
MAYWLVLQDVVGAECSPSRRLEVSTISSARSQAATPLKDKPYHETKRALNGCKCASKAILKNYFWCQESQLFSKKPFPRSIRFVHKRRVSSLAPANRDVRGVQIVTGRFGAFDLFRFREQSGLKIPIDLLKVSVFHIHSSCFTGLSYGLGDLTKSFMLRSGSWCVL